MKVCIVSDSHDRGPMLAAAIAAAKAEGAQAVIHCGDLIGANTLKDSFKLDLPLHVIHGNNLGDIPVLAKAACNSGGQLIYHGGDATLELGGRRIFVTHYPHHGRGMACTGDFDLVCCGHSHKPLVTQQANVAGKHTWLVNPGTVAGLGAPFATWVLGDLDVMVFNIRHID